MSCNNKRRILTCSDIWRHIKGSVWMNREQVFLLSSLGLVALRLLRWWLGWLASLEYLCPGVSVSPFHGSTFGLSALNIFSILGGWGSGSPEFCTLSIHSAILSVMPQPLESPGIRYLSLTLSREIFWFQNSGRILYFQLILLNRYQTVRDTSGSRKIHQNCNYISKPYKFHDFRFFYSLDFHEALSS